MSEPDDATPSGEEQQNERPETAQRRPEKERKVWAEAYPGGDVMVELGHMDTGELYLQSGEAEALRDVLNELLGDADAE